MSLYILNDGINNVVSNGFIGQLRSKEEVKSTVPFEELKLFSIQNKPIPIKFVDWVHPRYIIVAEVFGEMQAYTGYENKK